LMMLTLQLKSQRRINSKKNGCRWKIADRQYYLVFWLVWKFFVMFSYYFEVE